MMKILYLAILAMNGNAIKMQRCIAKQIQVTVRREMQINPMLMQRAYFGETFKQTFNYTKMKTWLEEVDWGRVISIMIGSIVGVFIIQYKSMYQKCKEIDEYLLLIKKRNEKMSEEMYKNKINKIKEYKKHIETYEKKIKELKENNSPQDIINSYQDTLHMYKKILTIYEK